MKFLGKTKRKPGKAALTKEMENFLGFVKYQVKQDPNQGQLIIKALAQHFQTERMIAVASDREVFFFHLPGMYYTAEEWNEEIKPYPIADSAVISCIWNRGRLGDNLLNIGTDAENPFKQDEKNHYSYLVLPVNLILVHTGNHSVNAAIMKEEGCITPTELIDWTSVYEEGDIYFDGECFCSRTGQDMRIYEGFPKDLGLMFEVGRILYEIKKEGA